MSHRARGISSVSNGQAAQNGTSTAQWSVGADDALALDALARQVVAEEVPPVLLEVAPQRLQAPLRARREMAGGPHLAVRVRVAATHHGALVLEDLNVRDPRLLAEARDLIRPGIDHGPDLVACPFPPA